MNNLLNSIKSTQSLPGWCSYDKACRLAGMIIALRPEISLEVGIYGGRSFLPMALAHKFIGKGTVIGIEPWSYEAAIEGYDDKNKDWWLNHSHLEQAKSSFLRAANLLGVANVMKVHEVKSDEFNPPDGIGVLHLDGQHSEQALRDVKRYAPKVQIGGFVVLDDVAWDSGGVVSAATWLTDNGFKQIDRIFNKPTGGVDDWAYYMKIK